MDDPVTAHRNWGYFCLVLGIAALVLTPRVFILLVIDFFEREEERLRLDYALTPKILREPWYFALKDKFWRALRICTNVFFAGWWLIFVSALLWIGVTMIRQSP